MKPISRSAKSDYLVKLRVLLLAFFITHLGGCGSKMSPEEHLQLARDYYQEKEYNKSILELKNALKGNTEYSEARMLLGELYLLQNQLEEAQGQFDRVRDAGIFTPELRLMLLKTLLRQRKYIEVLIDAPDIDDPGATAELLTIRAAAWLGQSKAERARPVLEKALELEPDFIEALLTRARLSIFTGEFAAANQDLDRIEVLEETNIELWLLRAKIALAEGNTTQAIASFNRARELKESDVRASVGLARLYLGQKDINAAREVIADIEKSRPNSVIARYLVGAMQLLDGDREKAKDNFTRALSIEPEHLESLLMMSQLSYEDGKLEQAYQFISSFRKEVPHYGPAAMLSAAINLRMNNPTRAINDLLPFVDDNSENPQFLTLLGSAYLADGDPGRGSLYFSKAAENAPADASIQSQLAMGQLQSGNIDLAIKGLESAVELDAGLLNAEITLIYLQLQRGNLEEAKKLARSAIESQPDNPVFHNLLGGVSLRQKLNDRAREHFQQAIAVDENYIPAHINLARIALFEEDREEATQYLEKILKINDSNEQALVILANLAIENGDYRAARLHLEQASIGNINALTSRLMLANYYINTTNLAKAKTIETELLESFPDSPDVLDVSARIAMAEGDTRNAISRYRRVIELQPDRVNAHLSLGALYNRMEDYAAAEKSLNRALESGPDNPAVLVELARLYQLTGRPEKVSETSRKIQTLHPDVPDAILIEADLKLSLGKPEEALELYRKAFRLQESSPLAVKISELMRKTGDKNAAMEFLKAWLQRYPGDSHARYVLGAWHEQDGDIENAIRLYRETLESDPDNIAALNNLGYLYNQQGDERALQYSQRAYELAPQNFNIIDTYAWAMISHGQYQQGLTLLEPVIRQHEDVDPEMIYHYAYGLFLSGNKSEAKQQLEKISDGKSGDDIPAVRELMEKLM